MVGLAEFVWMRFVWQESPAKESLEEWHDTILFATVVLARSFCCGAFLHHLLAQEAIANRIVQGFLCHLVCFVPPTCHIACTGSFVRGFLCDLLVPSS